jgi:type II secretory pathway pseudopilin PulG
MGHMGIIRSQESGFTILELIITLFLSSFILLGVFMTFSSAVSVSSDQKLVIITRLQAEALLSSIGSEIKSLGNGVPFDQANFQIGESTLSDTTVTEPILISGSDDDEIKFRLNETGRTFLTMENFDPTSSLQLELTSVLGLEVGDIVYITDSVVGGDNGLYGTIASIDSGNKKITLNSSYEAIAGATFETGSLLEQVSTITYQSLVTGVTRDNGGPSVLMATNSSIAFDYMDKDGNSISLPLTQDILINTLRAVEVSVTVTSNSNMSNGSPYTVTVSQIFALRNLNYII